jgi:hypothetical protein
LKNIASKQRVQPHGEDGMSSHYGNESRESEKNHENRKNDPENAKTHVPANVMGGNQSDLGNEYKNPTRKDRPVEMDKQTRQVGVKNTRQIVGPGESDEDSQEDEPGHRGKEEIVHAVANGK